MRDDATELATAGVVVVGAAAIWILAHEVFPYHSLNHDEAVYLQQAAMLLEGQLFLHPPVEGVFRPWFFVKDGSRLYPKYAPVPAAIFAVGKLLGGYRLALVAVGAANLGLIAVIAREVFDRRTGLLAALFAAASPLFLIDSAVFLPYAPTTLLNLTFAAAYLRSIRTHDWRLAGVAGGAIGLAFFARPYTAVLFAAPFIVHALISIRAGGWETCTKLVPTATLGLVGVCLSLVYYRLMTGSALRFPYQAFAPRDGLGFGHREILGHEVNYTLDLALRANATVAELYFSEWIAGGLIGTALAILGLVVASRRARDHRWSLLAGVGLTVLVGNVYFWGNYNLVGDLDRAGDGLVAVLGPYYHFDLLMPTAVFAATGAIWLGERLHDGFTPRVDTEWAMACVGVVLLVGAAVMGAVTVDDFERRIEENMEATETFRVAYEPFEPAPPREAVVLLPTPYGDWLNHPFQPLRNDPGFDGSVVYAIDERPFAIANAYPERRLYRYGYRGEWAPFAGSPEAARLERIHFVSGPEVRLESSLGVPEGAIGVTARLSTDLDSAYFVTQNTSDELDLDIVITEKRVRLRGDLQPITKAAIPIADRDDIRLSVFVDYGPGGGFTYRFDLPVNASAETVHAISPRIEWCRAAQRCGGSATYIPESAPSGISVRAEFIASKDNP